MTKKNVKSYKDAGVDIHAADRYKSRITRIIAKTYDKKVLSSIGGFGGMIGFDKGKYASPVLVSSVDGVGTKLKVATMFGKHDTVGIDLVSHCANDIVVQGAKPLFFLDYIGTGGIKLNILEEVMNGLVKGCQNAGCSLIGGETAQMPDVYEDGDYDLVGTMVGVVERKNIIDGRKIKPGDILLGLPSNGLHTNGYTLARQILFDQCKLLVHKRYDEIEGSPGDILLRPHTLYSKAILDVMRFINIHGLCHITGGGFQGNIPRVLPPGCGVVIQRGSWPVLPIFKFMQEKGKIVDAEMYRTFNMGIGMIVFISPSSIKKAEMAFIRRGFKPWRIGRVIKSDKPVQFAHA
ncbi:MAG: phosphoribosylformylglycinamidine cyclo-ligase [Chlamydiota bacterium]|nr:phosphoribosylformylglycinamidine cyclo-ligase [Chlamydiota bacterium]